MLCPLLYVTHMSLIFCETHNRAVILTSFLANVQITALSSLCNDDIISAQTTYWRLQPVNTHFQPHSAIAVNLLNARNDLQLCVCFSINWLLFLSSLNAIFELIDCYFWADAFRSADPVSYRSTATVLLRNRWISDATSALRRVMWLAIQFLIETM